MIGAEGKTAGPARLTILRWILDPVEERGRRRPRAETRTDRLILGDNSVLFGMKR
jgi:hypothetical protein